MGRLDDYARRRARQKLRGQGAKNSSFINETTKFVEITPDTTAQFNDDDSTVTLKDGRVLSGSKIGDPSDVGGALVVGNRAIMPEERVKFTATGGADEAYVILQSSSNSDLWVKFVDDDANKLYLLSRNVQLDLMDAPSNVIVVSALFSPNARHLLIGAFDPRNDGGLDLYWAVLKDFSLRIIAGEKVVSWHSTINGTFTVPADPLSASAVAPGAPTVTTGYAFNKVPTLNGLGNCTGEDLFTYGETNYTQTWSTIDTENEAVASQLPDKKVTSASGKYVFSNNAAGEPIVDFVGLYLTTVRGTTAFHMSNVTVTAEALIEEPMCCATGNFVAECVSNTTITKTAMIDPPAGSSWPIHIDGEITNERDGCVTVDCSGPPSHTPATACMTLNTFFPAGCVSSTTTSEVDDDTILILAVLPTYPSASYSVGGSNNGNIDPLIYCLANQRQIRSTFSVVDLQEDGGAPVRHQVYEFDSTVTLTKELYDVTVGEFHETWAERYTSDVDVSESGSADEPFRFFRSKDGIAVGIWHSTSRGTLCGMTTADYVMSVSIHDEGKPVLATDTHVFEDDFDTMDSFKAVASELFQGMRRNSGVLAVKTYHWNSDTESVVSDGEITGPPMELYQIVDYIVG